MREEFCVSCQFFETHRLGEDGTLRKLNNQRVGECRIRSVSEGFPIRSYKDWCGEWLGIKQEEKK